MKIGSIMVSCMTLVSLFISMFPLANAQSAGLGIALTLAGETCFDGLMNQNETGIDCGGNCDACSVPGSGGGGSGSGSSGNRGGSIPNVHDDTPAAGEFAKEYFYSKDSIVEEIDLPDLPVTSFDLQLTQSNTNFSLRIFPVENIGRLNNATLYKTFKVEATGLEKEDIRQFELGYKVPIVWVQEKDFTIEWFYLMNFNGEWNKLNSKYLSKDENFYYFSANSNTLGYYAIVAKVQNGTTSMMEPGEFPVIEKPRNNESPSLLDEITMKKKIEIMGLSIILTALIGLSILHIFKKVSIKKDDELQKEETGKLN